MHILMIMAVALGGGYARKYSMIFNSTSTYFGRKNSRRLITHTVVYKNIVALSFTWTYIYLLVVLTSRRVFGNSVIYTTQNLKNNLTALHMLLSSRSARLARVENMLLRFIYAESATKSNQKQHVFSFYDSIVAPSEQIATKVSFKHLTCSNYLGGCRYIQYIVYFFSMTRDRRSKTNPALPCTPNFSLEF